MTNNLFLYETHLHTAPVSACAAASPEEQVRAYKRRGYTGVIVTDHFLNGNTSCPRDIPWAERIAYFAAGYTAAQKEGLALGLDVFLGWEYCCPNGTEFLTYGLDIPFLLSHPNIDRFPIASYSALVREYDGYLAQAHPFRNGSWISQPGPVSPNMIDGVEVFNASMPPHINQLARNYARRHGLPQQSGSDAHHTNLPLVSGIALRRRAASIFDIINDLKCSAATLLLPPETTENENCPV